MADGMRTIDFYRLNKGFNLKLHTDFKLDKYFLLCSHIQNYEKGWSLHPLKYCGYKQSK